MVSGANTAVVTAADARTAAVGPTVAVPAIAARVTVTRWVTGAECHLVPLAA